MITQEYNLTGKNSAVNVTADREARPKFWYVVQVRSCCERMVAKKLDGLGIENYVPLREEIRQWSDREKKISSVLIPMVVFIKVESERLLEIQKFSFIYGMLKYPGQRKPAIIPDEQIESMRFMVKASNGQVIFTPNQFEVGDKITILRGNLSGLTGIVKTNPTGKTKIGVIIDLLGCAVAEISLSDIVKTNIKE